ncbi:MAG: MOSC domain-containing protein [Oscillospiraceae bacterium]
MAISGRVMAVCTSDEKGVAKQDVGEVLLVPNHGLSGDAHAGEWHRQVSLLSHEKVEDFRARGATVENGGFGENLLVSGIDFAKLPVGTRLACGQARLEVTQIGKACHAHCAIYHQVGDCIMPREGIFAKVLQGGIVRRGDTLYVEDPVPGGDIDGE